MAKTKLEKLTETWKKVADLGFNVVKGSNGQLYCVTSNRLGSGGTAIEYNEKQALASIGWLLMEQNCKIEAKQFAEAIAYRAFKASSEVGKEISVRVAEREGKHFLDLCNEAGEVVEISKQGWRITTDHPVIFHRPPKAHPLPVPQRGGSLDDLYRLLLLDEHQSLLALGWLLSTLNERVEPFALVLQGEAGGGKSFLAESLISLIDPRDSRRSKLNFSSDNVLLTAAERWVLSLEEVPHLSDDKLSTICGIVTGMSYEARKKYKDGEVYSVHVRRPLVITSNSNLLAHATLLDRSIPLWREKIKTEVFRDASEVQTQLKAMTPLALGNLLDLFVGGLNQTDPGVPKERQLRMCAAASWVGKCMTKAGLQVTKLVDAMDCARQRARSVRIEDWPVLSPLEDLLERGAYHGDPTNLLNELNSRAPGSRFLKGWPGNANALGKQLREWAPDLLSRGYKFEETRTGRQRTYRLSKCASTATSTGSARPPELHSSVPTQQAIATGGSQTGEEVRVTHLPPETERAVTLAKVAPNSWVQIQLDDGGCYLFGTCAKQAAEALGLELDLNDAIRLSKEENDSVSDKFKYEGMCWF